MPRKKQPDKESDKKKDKEASSSKPTESSYTYYVSKDNDLPLVLSTGQYQNIAYSPIYTSSGTLSSTASYYMPVAGAAVVTTYPAAAFTFTPEKEELEDEITKLRKENSQLAREITTKTEAEQDYAVEISKLKKNAQELGEKQKLHYLLSRVHSSAHKKLLGSDKSSKEFKKKFEESKPCSAVIVSVDIRRSTDLMLKAKTPELYADFIVGLCTDLTRIILNNYGVFDKFTGDGILAFFPEFYSGQDALYWAIKAADECHSCFSKHYREKRNCFKTILIDVGLGIGMDFGNSHLVTMQDGLTVIGEPVVFACRFSGAEAGQTLLNQSAYEVVSRKYGEYVNFQETQLDIKHEGPTLAYLTTLSRNTYQPELPDWLTPSGTAQ